MCAWGGWVGDMSADVTLAGSRMRLRDRIGGCSEVLDGGER
jgi:hypothetical protein